MRFSALALPLACLMFSSEAQATIGGESQQGYSMNYWSGTGRVPPNVVFLIDNDLQLAVDPSASDGWDRNAIATAVASTIDYHRWARFGVAFTNYNAGDETLDPGVDFYQSNDSSAYGTGYPEPGAILDHLYEGLTDWNATSDNGVGSNTQRNLAESLLMLGEDYLANGTASSWENDAEPGQDFATCTNAHIVVITTGLPKGDLDATDDFDGADPTFAGTNVLCDAFGYDTAAGIGSGVASGSGYPAAAQGTDYACQYDDVVAYLAQTHGIYVHTLYLNDSAADAHTRFTDDPGGNKYDMAAKLYENAGDEAQARFVTDTSLQYNTGSLPLVNLPYDADFDGDNDTLAPFYMRLTNPHQLTAALTTSLTWIRQYNDATPGVGNSTTANVRIDSRGPYLTVSYRESYGLQELNTMGFDHAAPVGRMRVVAIETDPTSANFGKFNLAAPTGEVSDRLDTRSTAGNLGFDNPGSTSASYDRQTFTYNFPDRFDGTNFVTANTTNSNNRIDELEFEMHCASYGSFDFQQMWMPEDVLCGGAYSGGVFDSGKIQFNADREETIDEGDFWIWGDRIRGHYDTGFALGEAWGSLEHFPDVNGDPSTDYSLYPEAIRMEDYRSYTDPDTAVARKLNLLPDFGNNHPTIVLYGDQRRNLTTSPTYRVFEQELVSSDHPDIALIAAGDGMIHAFTLEDAADASGLHASYKAGDEIFAWAPASTFAPFSTEPAHLDGDAFSHELRGYGANRTRSGHGSLYDYTNRGRTLAFGNITVRDVWIDGYGSSAADDTPQCTAADWANCEWRRVALVTGGELGPEKVFLDITDPGAPELLWELQWNGDWIDYNDAAYVQTHGGGAIDVDPVLVPWHDTVNDVKRYASVFGSGYHSDPNVEGVMGTLKSAVMITPVTDVDLDAGAGAVQTSAGSGALTHGLAAFPEEPTNMNLNCSETQGGGCVGQAVGAPTVLDTDFDGTADTMYIPTMDRYYSSAYEGGGDAAPGALDLFPGSSVLIKACAAGDNTDATLLDYEEVFNQKDDGTVGQRTRPLYYPPTTAWTSEKDTLGVYFGTGTPMDRGPWEEGSWKDVHDERGGFFFRVDTAPSSCSGGYLQVPPDFDCEGSCYSEIDDNKGMLKFERGERLVGKPVVFGGYVFFTTWKPHATIDYDYCGTLGLGRLYAFDYETGAATLDLDNDGSADAKLDFVGQPSNIVITDQGNLLVLTNSGSGPAQISAGFGSGVSMRNRTVRTIGYMQVY